MRRGSIWRAALLLLAAIGGFALIGFNALPNMVAMALPIPSQSATGLIRTPRQGMPRVTGSIDVTCRQSKKKNPLVIHPISKVVATCGTRHCVDERYQVEYFVIRNGADGPGYGGWKWPDGTILIENDGLPFAAQSADPNVGVCVFKLTDASFYKEMIVSSVSSNPGKFLHNWEAIVAGISEPIKFDNTSTVGLINKTSAYVETGEIGPDNYSPEGYAVLTLSYDVGYAY